MPDPSPPLDGTAARQELPDWFMLFVVIPASVLVLVLWSVGFASVLLETAMAAAASSSSVSDAVPGALHAIGE